MAKIHGLIYIIAGLFVSIVSWRLNYDDLIFFFYIGLLFILVGVGKIAFKLIKNRASKKELTHHKTPIHNLSAQQQTSHLKHCHSCGNVLRIHDRFCNRCGARV